jgi:hypothetical protein
LISGDFLSLSATPRDMKRDMEGIDGDCGNFSWIQFPKAALEIAKGLAARTKIMFGVSQSYRPFRSGGGGDWMD